MSNNLNEISKALIEKKLITEGSMISAKVHISGFGGAPITKVKKGKVTKIQDDCFLVLYEDKKTRLTKFEDIEDIEGMDIMRYAQAYRIKVKPKKSK